MSASASRPALGEAAAVYHGYIAHVPDGDILDTLDRQLEDTATLMAGVQDGALRYAPDKWTIRQVLLHIIDTERVFTYRALRFARGDETPLPGFDQDKYIVTSDVSDRSIGSLMDEFRSVRSSTLSLLHGLDAAAWDRVGVASGYPMTTRGAAWVIAGHERHHATILRDRYLAA